MPSKTIDVFHPSEAEIKEITTFAEAIKNGDEQTVAQYLKDYGVDITRAARNYSLQMLSMISAVRAGHLNIVKILLGAGVSPDEQGLFGPALLDAIHHHRKDIAECLLEAGADVEAVGFASYKPLSLAANEGDIDMARLLLKYGANVEGDKRKPKGLKKIFHISSKGREDSQYYHVERPLIVAAGKGHKDIAELLLDNGAKADNTDDNGVTPLMKATEKGHQAVVQLLLDRGAKKAPDFSSLKQDSAVFLDAVKKGDEAVVSQYLKQYGMEIYHASVSGFPDRPNIYTPLIFAVQAGHKKIVEMLLDAGAPIVYQKPEYETALTQACYKGHTDIAELLLGHGADIEAKDTYDSTPLVKAAIAGHNDVIRLLLKRGARVNSDAPIPASSRLKRVFQVITRETAPGKNPVIEAIDHGHIDTAKLLIENGANINGREYLSQDTVLMHAVSRGNKEFIEFLVSKGARIDARNNNKVGVLEKAASYGGNKETVEFLLSKGLIIDFPILHSGVHSSKEMVEYLLDKGINIEEKDKNGATPLSEACASGFSGEDVVKCLLDRGADLQTKDNYGRSPFLRAAGKHAYGSVNAAAVVTLLLDRGANIADYDHQGQTALMEAAIESRNKDVLKVLIERGADLDAKNNDGKTALDLAIAEEAKSPQRKKFKEIIILLESAHAAKDAKAEKERQLQREQQIKEVDFSKGLKNPLPIPKRPKWGR